MEKPTHFYFLLYLCSLLSTLVLTIPTSNASSKNLDQTTNLFNLLKAKRSRNSLSTSWAELSARAWVHVEPQDGLLEADKIGSMPGQPAGVDFGQYSGYVTVDPRTDKGLFYYFAESPQNASEKPLVLWLNGGPGCSSFGNGGLLELGPFRVSSNGKSLLRNKYAWNNVANVVFLESPAGVGFSYGNVSTIYEQTGDLSTAKDAYTFLINWLERFPHYKNRDFYLTGESYAGHYVPQLAYTILQNNKIMANKNVINLKGIAIGNAWIDDATNTAGMYDFLWNHAMYSDETHSKIIKFCNFSASTTSDECDNAVGNASEEIGSIDIYNVYAPICHNSGHDKAQILDSVEVYDPCSSNYVDTYLNSEDVQKALHVKPTKWASCSGMFDWKDSPSTVLPVIQKLMESKISVWIYSGDVDGRVPVTSSKYSINTLKLPIKSPWRPWYTGEQVGGYVVEYEGLVFVTIRGAGHLVPSYQPQRALTMISSFLQGTLPPQS